MTQTCHSKSPNWGISFTITNAWEAKCHASTYGSKWRKEEWTKWFAFLKTIGVYYDRDKREYLDI